MDHAADRIVPLAPLAPAPPAAADFGLPSCTGGDACTFGHIVGCPLFEPPAALPVPDRPALGVNVHAEGGVVFLDYTEPCQVLRMTPAQARNLSGLLARAAGGGQGKTPKQKAVERKRRAKKRR